MPATSADLAELRGIIHCLEHPEKNYPTDVRRHHIDALKRLLHTIEYGDPQSPVWWACGALKKSLNCLRPGVYYPNDPELYRWALDRIFELYPDD